MIPKMDGLAYVNDFQLLSPNWGIASAMRIIGRKNEKMPRHFFFYYKENFQAKFISISISHEIR